MKAYHLLRLRDLLIDAAATADANGLSLLAHLIKMALLQLADDTEHYWASRPNSAEKVHVEADTTPSPGDLPPTIVGSWDWQVQRNIVQADPDVARLFSISEVKAKQGLPLKEFAKAIHPADVFHIKSAIQHSVNTGASYSVAYRVVQRDKSVRWVFAIGKAVIENGKAVRFPGTIMDITCDERRKQRAIKFSESRQSYRIANYI